jgi:hypothetical protein
VIDTRLLDDSKIQLELDYTCSSEKQTTQGTSCGPRDPLHKKSEVAAGYRRLTVSLEVEEMRMPRTNMKNGISTSLSPPSQQGHP